jgi:tetratricopeptide (TPR) repeat protein
MRRRQARFLASATLVLAALASNASAQDSGRYPSPLPQSPQSQEQRRPAASAATAEHRRWCDGEDEVTAEQRIEGCSALIKARKDKGEKLAEIYNNRGVAYRIQGDIAKAIADYGRAIRLHSKFAFAYNNRGVAYDYKGDYDRAIEDFEHAIKLRPFALAYFNRGNAHLAKRQYDHAIDDYNQAIRMKPDFAAALDNRCWARAVVGILKPALADCNEALELAPASAATHSSRGFLYLKMTLLDAAVSDFDRALRIDPKHAFALYGRGLAKLKNGDATGQADLAAAKEAKAEIAEEFGRYGLQ